MTETERNLLIALAEAICEDNKESKAFGTQDTYVMVRIYLKELKGE